MQEPTRSRAPALLLEAHKRGVARAAVAYGVTAFAIYQAGDLLTTLFQLPLQILDLVSTLIILGFPLVLILSWTFVWTIDGLHRADTLPETWESSPRVAGYAKAFLMGVAFSGMALWWLKPSDGVVARGAEVMAVLPFTVSGEGANHLAEGLVDLLTINIEGVAALRTANSRIVLRLHREGRSGNGDLPAALAR